MTRLYLVAFALLALTACGSDPAAQPDLTSYRAHITGRVGDATVDLVVVLEPVDATQPTATPIPLTVAASSTPLPTNTPRPSMTPTARPATATPLDPTAEITQLPTIAQTTIPPSTEIPPTPEPSACLATVTVASGNIRQQPTTASLDIGDVTQGQVLAIEGRQTVGAFTWYRIFDGWVRGDLLSVPTGDCAFTATAWGVWTGPGMSRDQLVSFGRRLQAGGIQPAFTVYGEPDTANMLYDAGWLVAWRPAIPDCPNMAIAPTESARQWFAKWQSASTGVRYTYAVLSNECTWNSAAYLRDWIGSALNLSRAAGIKRIIPIVFNSGAPEFDWIAVINPALIALRGAGGCIGFNHYPVRRNTPLSTRDSFTRFTTFRYEMLDLPDGLDVCVTEAAAGAGDQVPNMADIQAYVPMVAGRVRFVTLWYVTAPGLLPAWINANMFGRLSELASCLEGVA